MSMITATAWVPRGTAAQFPTKYAVDDDELARISKLAKLKLEDAQEEFDDAQKGKAGEMAVDSDSDDDDSEDESNGVKLPQSKSELDDDLKEYDLEHYDSDSATKPSGGPSLEMFGNPKSLAYHDSNADDPYITLNDSDASEDEREELQVLQDDNLLISARVEDEVAHLEIYVYEDEADNLYVHHDIMLPAIPLCVEWLNIPVGKTASGDPVDQSEHRNFVAVGTFDPDIEIWDLDTVDCMYPNAILGQGGEDEEAEGMKKKKKKKRRKRSRKANSDYHVDAVLSLAWQQNQRTLLASASADTTVKLWNLETTQCAQSYSFHTDKACALAWHPTTPTILLTGSYDRTVCAAEMRTPDAQPPRWGVDSDVETIAWDPINTNNFFVGTEAGFLYYYDMRMPPKEPAASKPVWKLSAHDGPLSALAVSPHVPGLVATGGQDKTVKLWNMDGGVGSSDSDKGKANGRSKGGGPGLVTSRNPDVGKVFSATFAPDAEVGFRLAVAGSKGSVRVWDTSTNAGVRRAFAERKGPAPATAAAAGTQDPKEKFVGIEHGGGEDSEDSEDSSDEGEGGKEGDDDDDDEQQNGEAEEKGWESMDED